MHRRFCGAVLAAALAVGLLASPVQAAVLQDPDIQRILTLDARVTAPATGSGAMDQKIALLREKFPAGKYWNHAPGSANDPDSCTDIPCSHHYSGGCHFAGGCGCNSFLKSIQCMGYAAKAAWDVFGTDWRTWPRHSDVNAIQPGDIIRINGDGHSAFVVGVDDQNVYTTELNYKDTCLIRWDGVWSKAQLASILTYCSHATNYDEVYYADFAVDTLTAQGISFPETLAAGDTLALSGVLLSAGGITSVAAQVLDAEGGVRFEQSAAPGAALYSLRGLDGAMAFHTLEAGAYTFTLSADDDQGRRIRLARPFTVASEGETATARYSGAAPQAGEAIVSKDEQGALQVTVTGLEENVRLVLVCAKNQSKGGEVLLQQAAMLEGGQAQ